MEWIKEISLELNVEYISDTSGWYSTNGCYCNLHDKVWIINRVDYKGEGNVKNFPMVNIYARSINQSRISENNQIFLFTGMSYGHVSLLINALQNKWNQLSFLHVDLVNVFWYPMILCSPQKHF